MKKPVLIFVSILICISAVFSIDLGGGVCLDLVKADPLYKESRANPYSYISHLYAVYIPSEEDTPFPIRALVKDSDGKLQYKDFQTKELTEMNKLHFNVNMKLAQTSSLARITYKNFEAETNVNGYLNALFLIHGNGDCLGFDGSYFIGESFRIYDKYSFRFGWHHLSGHYGDESVDDFFSYNNYNEADKSLTTEDGKYTYCDLATYVRDNNIQLAASADFFDCLHVYGSAELPLHTSWIRPFIHSPAKHKTASTHGADGFVDLAESDGVDLDVDLEDVEAERALRKAGYMALQFDLGAEYEKQFSFGSVFVSVDFQAYQDGQTKHQTESYSNKNNWDYEFTAGTGISLSDSIIKNRTLSFEVFYHYGRPAVSQFFYKNGFSDIRMGISVR